MADMRNLHCRHKKKTTEAGRIVAMRKLNNWTKAIVNHFHHCTHTTPLASTLRSETWLSMLAHVTDVHEHPENSIVKRCDHEPILAKTVDGKVHVPDWLKPGKGVTDVFISRWLCIMN